MHTQLLILARRAFVLTLSLLLPAIPGFAAEHVILQLNGAHSFQFAGYYAAKEQGYYREAGLDVEIKESDSSIDLISKVTSDQAQFGIGDSTLLLARHAGQPVVALAVIFQHSPQVLIARQEQSTQDIHSLLGKRIGLAQHTGELSAFLQQAGLPAEYYIRQEYHQDYTDLMTGKTDAISASSIHEPFFLDRAIVPYHIYSPRSIGIDFYGDALFTSEQELKTNPGRTQAFTAASLQGWRYALTHQAHIADLIFDKYSRNLPRDFYSFEAAKMLPLIRPDLIEIGQMDPGRWQHIAQTYSNLGLLPQHFSLDDFLYHKPPVTQSDARYLYLALGLALIAVCAGVALYVYPINRRLRRSIAQNRKTEEALQALSIAVEQNPASVVITGLDAAIEYVNTRFTDVTGYSSAEAEGKNAKILNSGLTDKAVFEDMWRSLSQGKMWSGEFINRRKNGEIYWEEAHISPVQNANGDIHRYVAVKLDVTERKRAEQYEQSRNQVLELLARDAPVQNILEAIVRSVEQVNPDMLCSILLLTPDGRHLHTSAAPSLPDFYNEAIQQAEIGNGVGSCGTAAYTGKRVIVADIQTHPYWESFKELADRAGVQACWSEPIFSASGKILGTFAIYHHKPCTPTAADIRLIEQSANLAAIAIDRSLAIEALRISEERHRLLADNASDVIWTMDIDGCFTYISPSVKKMRGYTAAEAIHHSINEVLTPESAAIAQEALEHVFKAVKQGKPAPEFRGELEQRCKDGSTIWTDVTTTGIYNAENEFIGILGVTRDISQQKLVEARITHMAQHDPLTNLPNRALFSDRLQQALAHAQRDQNHLAVMFLDLDEFKPINDTFGHSVGDLLLQEAAKRMQSCVRAADTVARIGGDEFVVLLPIIGSDQDALRVAEKIRCALSEPFLLAGESMKVSSSIGISIYPQHGTDEMELSKNADNAMYQAKESGRNAVRFYSEDDGES